MQRTIYDELGVEPIINAAGTFSYLGGCLMSDEVIRAWCEAARQFVDIDELLTCTGERIATLIGVDSALVTGGAASSILLGTAAAITAKWPTFPSQSSSTPEPFEVLRPRTHRDLYDRQVEMCGVKLVDVENLEDASQLVKPQTVMMLSYNFYEPSGGIRHKDWLAFAKVHGIPTFLDAAADVPPLTTLHRFTDMGFDMVSFSGGKAMRGPQGSGLLVGGQEWIARARQNAFPREGVVGRVAKVSKEDIVALCKAIECFVRSDIQTLTDRCIDQLEVIAKLLATIPQVTTSMIVPPVANQFPHLLVKWDEVDLGMTPAMLKQSLLTGKPRIAIDRVYGTGSEGMLLSAINLQPGEAEVVGERVRALLQQN